METNWSLINGEEKSEDSDGKWDGKNANFNPLKWALYRVTCLPQSYGVTKTPADYHWLFVLAIAAKPLVRTKPLW